MTERGPPRSGTNAGSRPIRASRVFRPFPHRHCKIAWPGENWACLPCVLAFCSLLTSHGRYCAQLTTHNCAQVFWRRVLAWGLVQVVFEQPRSLVRPNLICCLSNLDASFWSGNPSDKPMRFLSLYVCVAWIYTHARTHVLCFCLSVVCICVWSREGFPLSLDVCVHVGWYRRGGEFPVSWNSWQHSVKLICCTAPERKGSREIWNYNFTNTLQLINDMDLI